jgi:hypothetical protein
VSIGQRLLRFAGKFFAFCFDNRQMVPGAIQLDSVSGKFQGQFPKPVQDQKRYLSSRGRMYKPIFSGKKKGGQPELDLITGNINGLIVQKWRGLLSV